VEHVVDSGSPLFTALGPGPGFQLAADAEILILVEGVLHSTVGGGHDHLLM
jgi:hypothetical protein